VSLLLLQRGPTQILLLDLPEQTGLSSPCGRLENLYHVVQIYVDGWQRQYALLHVVTEECALNYNLS
jgi:hypothetical protein